MSISTELTRLQKAKTDIKAAIEAKGVTVPSNDRIDEYSTYISQISSGASLNIAYGNTAPTDTSKLWIKGNEPEKVTITIQQLLSTLSTLSTTLSKGTHDIGTAAVGTKIYLFGGNTSNGRLNTIQVFDTTNNTISTLPTTLPTAASGIGVTGVGTKIYLFGGYTSSNPYYLNTIQVFDTTNNTITTLSTTLPTNTESIATVAVDTKIYLFGGNCSSGTKSTIQVFDTTNNTISTLSTTLPTNAKSIGAAAVGIKIYLFGGYVEYGVDYLNTINVFLTQIPLITNNILITEGQQGNIFNLISSPTQVEISVKNVYRGNSSNVAELNDAYLYNGSVWLNVNE